MKINLQSYFIKIQDNLMFGLYTKKRSNTLDKTRDGINLYEKFLEEISKLRAIEEKKQKLIYSTDLENFKEKDRLLGSFYYGSFGEEERVTVNIENGVTKNIEPLEAIQQRYLFFIDRFRYRDAYFIILIIEKKGKESPITFLKEYIKKNYKFEIEKFIEKGVISEVLKKNKISSIEYTKIAKKSINNEFALVDEDLNLEMDIKKKKVELTLEKDLMEKEKEKLISEYYSKKIGYNEYIKVKFGTGKEKRIVKIDNLKVSLGEYTREVEINEIYNDGIIIKENIEYFFDNEFNFMKKNITGEDKK